MAVDVGAKPPSAGGVCGAPKPPGIWNPPDGFGVDGAAPGVWNPPGTWNPPGGVVGAVTGLSPGIWKPPVA